MDTARLRFKESTEMVLNALENGYAEYHGELIEQPRVDIRPRPLKSMRGRVYAAAVSPESAKIMAELGVGILIVPQKPWKAVRQELQDYRDVYRQAEEKAREYIGGYWDTIIKHYEFDKPHLKDTKGYEAHGTMYDRLKAPGGMEMMTDFFVNLQIWGSPQQVFDKIMKLQDETHMDGYMGVFSFAGMPISEADKSMKLFAREVMPELQKLAPVQERLGIPA